MRTGYVVAQNAIAHCYTASDNLGDCSWAVLHGTVCVLFALVASSEESLVAWTMTTFDRMALLDTSAVAVADDSNNC